MRLGVANRNPQASHSQPPGLRVDPAKPGPTTYLDILHVVDPSYVSTI